MKNLILIALVFSVLLFAGCTGPLSPPTEKTGKLTLSITDKKVEGLEALYVTVSSVEIHKVIKTSEVEDENSSDDNSSNGENSNSGWVLFSSEEKTFDLMKLDSTQGLKALIGVKELEAGKYTQIRFTVKEVKAVIDGKEFDVEVPSNKLKIVKGFEVIAGEDTELIIDFSPESVIQSGAGYKLKPVLKLLTEKEFKERHQNQNQNELNLDKYFFPVSLKFCEQTSDCACGTHIKTGECFFGNKEFVDTEKQCPDFCTGIAGNLEISCVNNKCKQQAKAMTEEQARIYAEKDDSECMQYGTLKETTNYNENSKTWWIDLDAIEPQQGCNPACVVSNNGKAEVNWRCTGLTQDIVVVDDSQFLEQACDAVTSCPEGFECAQFPDIGLKCYPLEGTESVCDFVYCPSYNDCVVAESYPVQVMCSPKGNQGNIS